MYTFFRFLYVFSLSIKNLYLSIYLLKERLDAEKTAKKRHLVAPLYYLNTYLIFTLHYTQKRAKICTFFAFFVRIFAPDKKLLYYINRDNLLLYLL